MFIANFDHPNQDERVTPGEPPVLFESSFVSALHLCDLKSFAADAGPCLVNFSGRNVGNPRGVRKLVLMRSNAFHGLNFVILSVPGCPLIIYDDACDCCEMLEIFIFGFHGAISGPLSARRMLRTSIRSSAEKDPNNPSPAIRAPSNHPIDPDPLTRGVSERVWVWVGVHGRV